MAALHILGNGFDRKHKLPTSYDPHLREIAIRSERFAGEWDSYSEAGELWSDVEEQLAFPNTDGLIEHLECYAPDMLSERESDRDGIIHEAEQLLSFPLEEFARRADEAVEQARPLAVFQKMFDPGDFFLTFNYTHTLERLYLIDSARILHLHGEVGGEPLILGYAQGAIRELRELREWNEEENFDYYRSTAHNVVEQRLLDFEKKYQTKKLAGFLERLRGKVDEVIVYGFSFGRVDSPYFHQLAPEVGALPWTVLAYREDALENACAQFDQYKCGIKFERRVLEE